MISTSTICNAYYALQIVHFFTKLKLIIKKKLFIMINKSLPPPTKDEITLVGRVCPKVGTKISKIKNFANNKGFVNERLARFIKNFIRTILGPLYTYYVKKKHSY